MTTIDAVDCPTRAAGPKDKQADTGGDGAPPVSTLRGPRPNGWKRASAAAEGKRRCAGQQCGIDVAVDAARLGKAGPE